MHIENSFEKMKTDQNRFVSFESIVDLPKTNNILSGLKSGCKNYS